jgi:glycosyltransferase involved in cell wall biosynthesis
MEHRTRVKIFFWPASSEDGTYLYRVKMQAEALAARGHEVEVSQRMSQTARESADVIVGQRIAMPGPTWMWQAIADEDARLGRRRLVYEVDDDLLAINILRNPLGKELRQADIRRAMIASMERAALLTVSTEPLARSLSRFNPNVWVLPNSVQESIFDIPLSTRRGSTTYSAVMLGWQGSSTHEHDWALIQPVVAEALATLPHVVMRFLGTAYPTGLPPTKWMGRNWTTDLAVHYRRVASFDIGLAPLEDTAFNRCKSGLKFIEYAALGVPSICSNVSAYRDLVEHGVTGFLATTPEQWRKHLWELIHDPAMRVEIGDAARRAARAWTIEQRIPLWENAYASLTA